ncbi:hypothetical protein D3C73_908960 [compost metagenome]
MIRKVIVVILLLLMFVLAGCRWSIGGHTIVDWVHLINTDATSLPAVDYDVRGGDTSF